MEWNEYAIRLGAALLLGCVVGFERQHHHRMAGLRTNALVALGSASFVTMGSLLPGRESTARIAAQIVTGIGFLGGGVILREGLNVRGLNTAATVWCSAANRRLRLRGISLRRFISERSNPSKPLRSECSVRLPCTVAVRCYH